MQVKKLQVDSSQSVNQKDELLEATRMLRKAILVFSDINEKANVIAVNAEIEGARMGRRLPTFSIVAKHIHTQSKKNSELRERLEELVGKIENVVFSALAARNYELAEDLIDKLDRNLFERNCDCQAWATFDSVVRCTEAFRMHAGDQLKVLTDDETAARDVARALLERLVKTYCVYSDIFVVNQLGVVINTARRPELIGQDWSNEEWVKEGLAGKVCVTDMNLCPATHQYSVFYTAPIVDATGDVIGALSTRFNWDFAQEMIYSANYEPDVKAYITSENAVVLAASQKAAIMRDALDWLDAGAATMKGECGYSIEAERNAHPIVCGFARTRGYNAYRGKNWSSIVYSRLKGVPLGSYFTTTADVRTLEKPLGNRAADELIESEKANHQLKKTMEEIDQLLKEINQNNKEAKFLAINASIQAGIAGEEGEGFAIIAEEIGALAKKSLEFVDAVNRAAEKLRGSVEGTVNTRLVDAARDCVDKVDRNLFERYCDVQAWTTFKQFIDAIADRSNNGEACELLAKLHKIYEVYHDIYLLDLEGNIIATGINRALIGQNQKDREWFMQARSGITYFSNVYMSRSVGEPTVAFAAPVMGSNGQVIGVLTTRFNCNFLNDILKAVIVDSKSEVFLVDSDGLTISARRREDVMNRSFKGLESFKQASDKNSGYRMEKDAKSGETVSIGYAGGRGYNTYPGNNWSVLILRPTEGEEAVRPVPLKVVNNS